MLRLLLLSLLLLAPIRAGALPIVRLVFVATSGGGATGGDATVARPGDVLTAEIRIEADAAGVSAYGLSLEFDLDLGDELDVVSAQELTPAGFSFSFTPGVGAVQESTAARRGRLLTFEAATLGLGPAGTAFAIARIELRVTSRVASDGVDIVLGFFAPGVDGLLDNDGNDLSGAVTLGGGTIDAVPEPSTAALLALGLALLRRAQRPSQRPGTEKR